MRVHYDYQRLSTSINIHVEINCNPSADLLLLYSTLDHSIICYLL